MLRLFSLFFALVTAIAAPCAWSGEVGVILLHGKASMPSGLGMQNLAAALEAKGYLVSVPEMGWSRNRIYDASYDESMSEIDRIVQELRQKGAKKVIVAGQSQGANAALGYAAHREGADGIIALAPGHVPELGKFRDSAAASVSRAKALIEEGKGREKHEFGDNDQGKRSTVSATPEVYLSWFDPDGPAVMPKNAAAFKKPLPLLIIVGSREKNAKGPEYFFHKAPSHPNSKFVTVEADHTGVPGAAAEEILAWLGALQ